MATAVRLLCSGLSLLLYLNTLSGDLVFDDRAAIVENKDLLPSSPWSNLLWHDFWGDPLSHNKSHKSFRPLSSATFKLNYHLHQLSVTGYHWMNVLLNGLVCYLYVQLCELVFQREKWSTLIAGLLFSTHPLHTEAVASIVGRTELLCSLFFLLSLLTYHKATRSQTGLGLQWVVLSMVFCLCSFLSKEQGITALAVCLAYEAFIVLKMDVHSVLHLLKCIASHPKRIQNSHKRFIVRALIVSLFILVIVVCRILMMHGAPKFSRSDNPGQTLPTPFRHLYYLHLVCVNIWLLFNPSRLVHDWRFGFVPLFDSFLYPHHLQTFLTFISLLLFSYLCITTRRHHRDTSPTIAGFALSLMTVTFLPASNLFFLVGFVVAERVLYLPSMGFCILIAIGTSKMITSFNHPFLRKITKGAIFLLLFSYCTKTLIRNTKWLSGEKLFIEALKLNREDGLMYSNLGYSLENSNLDLAEKAHRVAVQMSPNYSQPFRNYGALLMRQGKFAEAEKMFQRATQILGTKEKVRSKSVETYQSLAYVISMNETRIPEALSVLEVALSMRPDVLELLNMKGYFLHKMKRSLESVAVLQRALKSSPENRDSLYHLGVAYSKLGEMERAEELLRKVIKLDSSNGRAMLRLGLVLAKKNPPLIDVLLEAGKYFRSVLLVDSNNIDALYGLGLVYTKLNKVQKGEEYFLRVLDLYPYHMDTMLDLGYLHYSRNNFTEVVRLMKHLPHSFLFSTPEYVQIGSMLVNSYIQLNLQKEAETIFKIMLHQDTAELQISALNGLGELSFGLGEYQRAKEYFSRTLEIDHQNQLALNCVEKLNSLLRN